MAADLYTVPRDGQRTGAGRQFLAQDLYEGAEPEALGLHGVHPARLQRQRGDRTDAGGQHVVLEGGEELDGHAPLLGAGKERRGGGRAGEGQGVDAAGDGGVEQPVDGPEVLRRHPPVDGHHDDVRSPGPQGLHEAGQRFAVQLERDAPPGDAFPEQPVEHLRHGLGRGRPLLREPGGTDGAFHLGPAGEQLDPAQTPQQRVAEAPPVGGLDPAAEPDGGGGDHDIGSVVDQLLGGGEQLAVVGERDDAQQPARAGRWRRAAGAARRARRRAGRR